MNQKSEWFIKTIKIFTQLIWKNIYGSSLVSNCDQSNKIKYRTNPTLTENRNIKIEPPI